MCSGVKGRSRFVQENRVKVLKGNTLKTSKNVILLTELSVTAGVVK